MEETLIPKNLAMLNVKHMNSMFSIKLINLASIRLGEVGPSPFPRQRPYAASDRLVPFHRDNGTHFRR